MLKITKVQTALLEWLYCHSKGQFQRELAHLESRKTLL